MSVLVIGTLAFDAIETPFGKTDKIIGGAATYITHAASYFHNPINLVSVVGYDFPKGVLESMKNRGIDLTGLDIKENEKSFFWSGKYGRDLNTRETLATELNVLESFDPTIPDVYQSSDFVMLGNLTPTVQQNIIRQFRQKPRFIALDTMNFWMDIMMDEVKKAIALVDVITINDEEARQLADDYSLVRAARKIMDMGPKYVIIKKGEHGALLFHEKEVFVAPALPLEDVFDPTGAGDTFAGGFIGYLARTGDISFNNMKNAVIYGSAMASFCVEKFGIERILDLSREEINDRCNLFLSLVQTEMQFF